MSAPTQPAARPMSVMAATNDPIAPQGANALEDLQAAMLAQYPEELRIARATPVDGEATKLLRANEDSQWENLAAAAEVEPYAPAPGDPPHEYLLDAAVRGPYVSFIVADAQGAPSSGFFSRAVLSASTKAKRAKVADSGFTQEQAPTGPGEVGGQPAGGTATVPSTAPEPPDPPPPTPPPAGATDAVPDNLAELNARDTIKLLKSPPAGVDPRAVIAAEQARSGERDGRPVAPRQSVLDAGKKLGL